MLILVRLNNVNIIVEFFFKWCYTLEVMSGLEKYIENLKEYFAKHPDFSETEKVMYVYIDLGKKFNFDQDFYFGGTKNQKRIYEHSDFADYLEESFDKNTIICKSSARICTKIFNSLGIDCRTQVDESDTRRFPHFYNIIHPKDGSESYSIDLQDDIENIKFHSSLTDFGLSLVDEENYVIPKIEQKRIHEKLGYISKTNPYMDEYLYTMKLGLDYFPEFGEKLDFIFQNIDPDKINGINYWERRWKHDKFLSKLLTSDEKNKLNMIELYKKNGDKRHYYNAYYFLEKGIPQIYIYSDDNFKYNKVSLHDYAELLTEGYECNQGIPMLKGEIRKIKDAKNEKGEK